MKTVMNYLEEHKKFEMEIFQYRKGKPEHFDVLMELRENGVYVKCDNNDSCIAKTVEFSDWVESDIQDLLNFFQLEIRFCEECGKPYDAGFMAGDGDWYCCEDCFDDAMNTAYGVGNWRATEEPGEYDGFYEAFGNGVWEDTGIFYTEWN